jgi:hypothetical protein
VFPEGAKSHTGADGYLPTPLVDCPEPAETTQREDDLTVVGNRTSDQTGVASLGDHGHAALVTDGDHTLYLIDRPRSYYGRSVTGPASGPIPNITGDEIWIDEQMCRPNDVSESLMEVIGSGHLSSHSPTRDLRPSCNR